MQIRAIVLYEFKLGRKAVGELLAILAKHLARELSMNVQLDIGFKELAGPRRSPKTLPQTEGAPKESYGHCLVVSKWSHQLQLLRSWQNHHSEENCNVYAQHWPVGRPILLHIDARPYVSQMVPFHLTHQTSLSSTITLSSISTTSCKRRYSTTKELLKTYVDYPNRRKNGVQSREAEDQLMNMLGMCSAYLAYVYVHRLYISVLYMFPIAPIRMLPVDLIINIIIYLSQQKEYHSTRSKAVYSKIKLDDHQGSFHPRTSHQRNVNTAMEAINRETALPISITIEKIVTLMTMEVNIANPITRKVATSLAFFDTGSQVLLITDKLAKAFDLSGSPVGTMNIAGFNGNISCVPFRDCSIGILNTDGDIGKIKRDILTPTEIIRKLRAPSLIIGNDLFGRSSLVGSTDSLKDTN
uniref:Peptidase A2 domain-containing protein n=1 Tax=Heterorhabditis bacteriophora TaxID=37862 RepID=A0A1I7W8D9_HETBA